MTGGMASRTCYTKHNIDFLYVISLSLRRGTDMVRTYSKIINASKSATKELTYSTLSKAYVYRIFIFQDSALDCKNGMSYYHTCVLKVQPNPLRECTCPTLGIVMTRPRDSSLVNFIYHINIG